MNESSMLNVRDDELEIAGDDPFRSDLFGRRDDITNLTVLVQNYRAPFVLALDGDWGVGKTTYIRLWQAYLESLDEPHEYITLNAWECDYASDPLIPLLSKIDAWLKLKRDASQKVRNAFRSVKRAAPALVKPIARATVKALTLNAVDTNELLEAVSPDAAAELSDALINQFRTEQSSIEMFKTSLSQCLEVMPQGQRNFIIFIDELDRCRPNFAIELLERAKHLFDIDRVVFVLALNKNQLGKSISGVYGEQFDGKSYLKRFIDLDFKLSIPSMETYVLNTLRKSQVWAYCNIRVRDGQDNFENINLLFSWYASRFNVPARTINQLVKRFGIVVSSIPIDVPMNSVLLTVMFLIRNHDSDLFESLPGNKRKIIDVIHWMYGENLAQASFPHGAGKMIAWLVYSEADPFIGGDEEFVKRAIVDSFSNPPQLTEATVVCAEFLAQLERLQNSLRIEENLRLEAFNRIERVKSIT